jgi:site-specific recombinase XerD
MEFDSSFNQGAFQYGDVPEIAGDKSSSKMQKLTSNKGNLSEVDAGEAMEQDLISIKETRTLVLGDADDPWSRAAVEWLTNFQSAATRRTYRSAWRGFLAWLGRHPASVTRMDIIAYRDDLAARRKRAATIDVKLAALASFFAYAKGEQLIERNPVDGIDRPKVDPFSAARWLTVGEAGQLLQAPDRASLEGKRDFTILVTMLLMGLRRAEVAGMRVGDLIERGDGTWELRYHPKGGEERTRPMPSAAQHAVREYLDARGEVSEGSPVFVAHDHAADTRCSNAPLTCEAIRQMVARYSRQALGREINPHALRHTCAGAAWDATHDLRRVQGLLGHASATTTEKYLHRRDDDRGALGDALAVSFGIA